MDLPHALRRAVDEALAPYPLPRLREQAHRLTRGYRDGGAPKDGLMQSPDAAAAYLAVRMPATFAAVSRALDALREALPGWTPATVLDVGAGPGTAAWAADAAYPGLRAVTLLEPSAAMRAMGQRLARAGSPLLAAARWIPGRIRALAAVEPHDLVVAGYLLGELDERERDVTVDRLWALSAGALLLLEPGTVAGFERIRRARRRLLEQGARLAAPCPHEGACPMTDNDWCHFAARLERSRLHRQLKGGQLGYEDEKFSYVAVTRLKPVLAPSRILRHPEVRAGQIGLKLCTPKGTVTRDVRRSDRVSFRKARHVAWGDRWALDESGEDAGEDALDVRQED